MKIGEAQKAYSARLQELSARRAELQRQHKENESAGRQQENEGVVLELSSVEKQYQKASDFMSDFNAYRDMLRTMESAKRQKKTAFRSMYCLAPDMTAFPFAAECRISPFTNWICRSGSRTSLRGFPL